MDKRYTLFPCNITVTMARIVNQRLLCILIWINAVSMVFYESPTRSIILSYKYDTVQSLRKVLRVMRMRLPKTYHSGP